MVAVINVNAYPFLVSSELTCHLEDRGIGFFLVALCCQIVRISNLGVTMLVDDDTDDTLSLMILYH